MSQETKRKVPPALQKLLEADKYFTEKFVLYANQFLPLRSLRIHYKALEITCHGIPWFAFWLAFTWLFNDTSLVQLQMNMLLGLLIDVIVVAVTKAFVRRKRPASNINDAIGEMGPDKFSFPSGHATRAVFVAYFFINLYPAPIFCIPPLLAWATSICLTRVLMCRHHLLDVAAGVVIGLLEGWLLGLLWMEEGTAKSILYYLSDEKLDGGEYHV